MKSTFTREYQAMLRSDAIAFGLEGASADRYVDINLALDTLDEDWERRGGWTAANKAVHDELMAEYFELIGGANDRRT